MDNTNSTPERVKGKHLDLEDRAKIELLHSQGYSNRAIARIIGVSHTTIGNELKRGTPERKFNRGASPKYKAKRAQRLADRRSLKGRKGSRIVSKCVPFLEYLYSGVRSRQRSIDSCVGEVKRFRLFQGDLVPCTKTVYNWIHRGLIDLTAFDLPESLSRRPKTRKRATHKVVFGKNIDERPEIAQTGSEFGHWEIDTVTGLRKGSGPAILTVLEKKTHQYLGLLIPGKDAASVELGMKKLKKEYGSRFSQVFKTITADNGREFCSLSETCEAWGE